MFNEEADWPLVGQVEARLDLKTKKKSMKVEEEESEDHAEKMQREGDELAVLRKVPGHMAECR